MGWAAESRSTPAAHQSRTFLIGFLSLFILVALVQPPRLVAQETIVSDRPGIGSGSFVLRPGTIQLEIGLDYSEAVAGHSYSFGQALLRVGVAGLEVELLANSYVVTRGDAPAGTPNVDGFQDVGVGIKLRVVRALRDRLALSLQGVLTTPSGSEALTSDEWVPALFALADLALGARASLGINLGYRAEPGGVEDVVTVIATPGVALQGGVGLYGGWAGEFAGGSATHFAEAGVTYLASADVQLDVNGGWNLDGGDWFFGAGIAVRRGSG